MDLCGEADGVMRSRWSSKKLHGYSPSFLLWLLNLTCLKRCQCMFSFPINYGTTMILYIEACFLIIVILNDIFMSLRVFLMSFYFICDKKYIFLCHWVFNWELFTRKFGWNTSICFKALVESRTQPESMTTLALLPQDYQISFPVLHPAGSVSCLWCFTPLNVVAEQPQSHCPIPWVGHSCGTQQGREEASSSSQEFCAWSAPFLLGFLNEHGFNCAGTVPINVITLAFAQGLCHIYHEGRMCTGSSVSINSPHMMLSPVSVETV